MGKKGRKHHHKKNRKEIEENFEEEDSNLQVEGSKRCPHLSKAVKLGVLQNHVPHAKLGHCSQCSGSVTEDTGVCICLRCGKQGCDRYSDDKHALGHYSDCPSHNVTLHLQSMLVWCYGCDMEVPIVPNSDLHECVKLVIKGLKLDTPNDQKLIIPKLGAATSVQKLNIVNSTATSGKQKIKGLVNLGNTCFFNSVMQNLNQTELLHVAMAFVSQSEYSQRIIGPNTSLAVQVTNPAGSLIVSLNKLLSDFRSSSPGPLNPKFLFSEICKKAPRFKGFQQQDSQELLRYLLDSVKTDQLKRVKIGVLKQFEVTEGVDIKSLPAEKKDKIKEYVHLVTAPCVDSVFAGKLDSIIVCHKCHKESRVTESFLDLSLSLVKPQEPKGKPKANKAGASSAGKKKNSVDQIEEAQPQTLSKHQQKVAKEAKRKKGRKKGKQRTLSRSSDDGSHDVKEQSVVNDDDTVAVESEHENTEENDSQDPEGDSIVNEHTTIMEENKGDLNLEEKCRMQDKNVIQAPPEFSNSNDTSLVEDEKDLALKEKQNASNLEEEPPIKKNVFQEAASEFGNSTSIVQDDKSIASKENKNTSNSQEITQLENNLTQDEESKKNNELKSNGNSFDSGKDLEVTSTLSNLDNTSKIEKEKAVEKTTSGRLLSSEQCHQGNGNSVEFQNGVKNDNLCADNATRNLVSDKKDVNSVNCIMDANSVVKDEAQRERILFEEKNQVENTQDGRQQVHLSSKKKESHIIEEKQVSPRLGKDKNVDKANKKLCSDSEKKDCVIVDGEKNVLQVAEQSSAKPENKEVSCNVPAVSTDDFVVLSSDIDASKRQDIGFCNCRCSAITENQSCNQCSEKEVPNNEPMEGQYNPLTENHSCNQCSKKELSKTEPNDINSVANSSHYEASVTGSELQSKAPCFVSCVANSLEKLDINNEQFSGLVSTGNEICRLEKKGNVGKTNDSLSSTPEKLSQENHIATKCLDNEHCNTPGTNSPTGCPYAPSPGECSLPCNTMGTNTGMTSDDGLCDNEDNTSSPRVLTIGSPYTSSPGECSVQSSLAQFCSPEVLEGKNKFLCEECSKKCGEKDDEDDGSSSDGSTKGAKAPKAVYTEATKQLLISSTPPVLTLHLKRFQQVGHGLRKVPKHVEFPFVLDISPFCCTGREISPDSKDVVLYSLIGLVEHSGGLNSGHYTACIKLKHKPTYNHPTNPADIKDFSSFIQELWAKDKGTEYTHEKPGDGQWYYVSDSRATMVTEEKVLRSQAYMLFYERLPLKRTSVM